MHAQQAQENNEIELVTVKPRSFGAGFNGNPVIFLRLIITTAQICTTVASLKTTSNVLNMRIATGQLQ